MIAPWRFWDLNSRAKLFDFAEKHDIPLPVTRDKGYSMDRNVLHISFEGIELEDEWANPKAMMKMPHSVLTEHLIDKDGEPTKRAAMHVIAFFREKLAGGPPAGTFVPHPGE